MLLQLFIDFSPRQSVPRPGRPQSSRVARRGADTEGSEGQLAALVHFCCAEGEKRFCLHEAAHPHPLSQHKETPTCPTRHRSSRLQNTVLIILIQSFKKGVVKTIPHPCQMRKHSHAYTHGHDTHTHAQAHTPAMGTCSMSRTKVSRVVVLWVVLSHHL